MLRFLRIAWKVFCYGIGAAVLIVVLVQAWFYAHVLGWNHYEPGSSAFMEARLERMREKDPKARLSHRWVGYEQISANLKRAVVAAEDAKFIGHAGFDWQAISKAIERNEQKGKIVAGASTISQQLAKNLFLSGERSYVRKGQEAVITWMIERTMSKRRILELYLNVAEWGEGIFGAEAAARHHFGVNAASLNASQSAYLAAILPSPRRYRGGRSTPYVDGRRVTILGRMASAQVP